MYVGGELWDIWPLLWGAKDLLMFWFQIPRMSGIVTRISQQPAGWRDDSSWQIPATCNNCKKLQDGLIWLFWVSVGDTLYFWDTKDPSLFLGEHGLGFVAYGGRLRSFTDAALQGRVGCICPGAEGGGSAHWVCVYRGCEALTFA